MQHESAAAARVNDLWCSLFGHIESVTTLCFQGYCETVVWCARCGTEISRRRIEE